MHTNYLEEKHLLFSFRSLTISKHLFHYQLMIERHYKTALKDVL